MTDAAEKRTFISDTLYHELRCLLGAATLWKAFKEQEAGFDVILAMDSAFVHARCLFNFFSTAKPKYDRSITEFGPPQPYESAVYDKWHEALHRHVLHCGGNRARPANLQGEVHLNKQVKAFGDEILTLWHRFEEDQAASEYSSVLVEARERAIEDAANDAHGRTEQLFV